MCALWRQQILDSLEIVLQKKKTMLYDAVMTEILAQLVSDQ